MARPSKKTQRPVLPEAAANLQQVHPDVAAEILDLQPRTLQDYRLKGGGPRFVRVSATCVRYRLTDLAAWQESRLRNNTAA